MKNMNKYLLQVLELAHNGIGKLMIETFNTGQQCHWRSWVGPKNFKEEENMPLFIH